MRNHPKIIRILYLVVLGGLSLQEIASRAAGIITFQAESGTLGANFTNATEGATQFISVSTDTVNAGNPGNVNRVASYTVSFPEAGTYNLFARIRVGTGGFGDDSLFYGNGFGAKSPALDGDWLLVNGLAAGGFTLTNDVVAGGGSAGALVWKWVNLSQFNPSGSGTETPVTFTVAAGNLTQTVQIGARENGLALDKLAFGSTGTAFTVSNLDNGTLPLASNLNTNLFIGPDGIALHRFSTVIGGLNQDGANPAAGLAFANGGLIGTTLNGGAQGAGAAFTLSLDGTSFSTFRAFTNAPDAGHPQGELRFSGSQFFGASSGGGSSGTGAIFVGQTNGSVSVLRSFAALNADNATNFGGASPGAALAFANGTLFGTASAGGTAANGTIYFQTTNGATFAVLRNFSALDANTGTNSDGAMPMGGVIVSGGTLFGTAAAGGAGGSGVVFSVGTNGANFTALKNFSPLEPLAATNADGAMPYGGLVLSNGVLYGTTFAGGFGGRGTVFSIATNGAAFKVLHHFTATDALTGTNADGASPCAALVLSSNVLYGTASAGGAGAAGAIFSVGTNGAQFNVIRSFTALANGTNADGAFPVAPLLRIGNSLYGSAFGGGPGGAGTVFSVAIPAPPAIIVNVSNNLDGSVTLHFLGGANTTNVIQSTVNLMPAAWQNISTNIADANGAWQFTHSINSTTRYYRSYAR